MSRARLCVREGSGSIRRRGERTELSLAEPVLGHDKEDGLETWRLKLKRGEDCLRKDPLCKLVKFT